MNKMISTKKSVILLICGIIGCFLMGASDWLMIYGDTAYEGNLAFLTVGVGEIPAWRNRTAMILAFPAVILYALALLGFRHYFLSSRHRASYTVLTSVGMIPWLSLHLFYTMIFYLFSLLSQNDSPKQALSVCEKVFGHFSWMIAVSEVLMLLPFFYLFCLLFLKKSVFPKAMALNNPLLLYLVLKASTYLMPDCAFRLSFVNGLMSESMVIFFMIYLFYILKRKPHGNFHEKEAETRKKMSDRS